MTTYRYRIGHNARRDSEDTLELDEPIRNEDELQHVLDVHLSEVCDVWCYRVDEDGNEIPLDQGLPSTPRADAEERDHNDPDDATLGKLAREAIDSVLTDGAIRSAHYLTIDGKPVRLIVRPGGPAEDNDERDTTKAGQ